MNYSIAHNLFGVILAIALTSFTVTSTASSFIKLDTPSLKQKSELVVKARVKNIRSAWNPSKTMLYSYITLDVTHTFKGTPHQQLEIRVPGGTLNGYTVSAIGTATFDIDSDVVAFVSRWENGALRVTGYQQGLSQIVLDSLGNETLEGGAAHGQKVSELAKQFKSQGEQP